MSYGLLDNNGRVFVPATIDCDANVTDDFGLFKLVHNYEIDVDAPCELKFVFPVSNAMHIVSFSAYINEKHIFSTLEVKPPKAESASYFSHYYSNGFEVPLGESLKGDKIVIEIVYTRSLTYDNERTRIIIPTGVAPRFIYFGRQLALETLFEEIDYNITLNVLYKNSDIKNVVSPTHNINAVYGENSVEVTLDGVVHTDRDIIIDVYSVMKDKPKFIKYDNYMSCSFIPDLNIYEDAPRDYLFFIDISNDSNVRKIQQIKNALQLCIRTLKKGDRFNIAFAQSENTFFYDEYLPLNDDTLRSAVKWLNSYVPQGIPEFYGPVVKASSMSDDATVIFVSDGRIAGNVSSLNYVKQCGSMRFYNFGFDMAVNREFLIELAAITGGKTRFVDHTERVDDTVVKAFNVIVSPSIDKAVVRFDTPISDITPDYFDRIHCGERINVMLRYTDRPPQTMYIKGFVGGKETVCAVKIEHILDGGQCIKYRFGCESIQNMLKAYYFADEERKYMIRQRIIEKSLEYSIHSKYTMFKIADRLGTYVYECDVEECSDLSSHWYETTLVTEEKSLSHSVREIQFTEIAKKQKANGRFVLSNSRSKDAVALTTAEVVLNFCQNCSDVFMYRWHLRKSVLFLLDYIENADIPVVPEKIIDALVLWNEIFGSSDEASQKIEVLAYLYK